MKALFLDIDGVLATEESSRLAWHEEFAYLFDPICVVILNTILEKTGAEIVLTSEWRIAFNNDLEALDRLFKYNKVNKSPIGVTSNICKDRNLEISDYLHKSPHRISSFVILDDMDIKIAPNRFVRTNIIEGLKQTGIAERTINIINSN